MLITTGCEVVLKLGCSENIILKIVKLSYHNKYLENSLPIV